MEYVLRTTRHRNMIRKSEDLEYILAEYNNRCERFPAEKFEVVDAQGDKIDVESIALGRGSEPLARVSEPVSEVTSEEVHGDTWNYSESSADSTH